jgi:hypothetical protein
MFPEMCQRKRVITSPHIDGPGIFLQEGLTPAGDMGDLRDLPAL